MEQQILRVINNQVVGNLTDEQVHQLSELALAKTITNRKIKGISINITVNRWQRGDRDRLYINKEQVSKPDWKTFGSQPTSCWIDVNNSQINSEGPAYGALLILAELFGLEIYFGGGLRAVAE
jgi:hypothetical protein